MFRIDKSGAGRRSKRRAQADPHAAAEEACLESIVFNRPDPSKFKGRSAEDDRPEPDEPDELNEEQVSFIIDNRGDAALLEEPSKKGAAVWDDEDDEIG